VKELRMDRNVRRWRSLLLKRCGRRRNLERKWRYVR